MSRTNRRHTRAMERHRRNKGPELLSRAADKKVEAEAERIVKALFESATAKHDTNAAGLLVELAERAEWEDPVLYAKVKSLAEKWASEPQVVMVDTTPQIEAGPKPLQLTDGSAANESSDGDPKTSGIIDAEWEIAGEPESKPRGYGNS